MNDYVAKHLFERNHYYNQASNVIQCDLKNEEEIANEILNLSS
jgi:shikimate kinase